MKDEKSLVVVIPVFNEAESLVKNIPLLFDFLKDNMSNYHWQIIIADNGSTDLTLKTAQTLAKRYPGVAVIRLEERGRGKALKKVWGESKADILSYMDVDLSTSLENFPELVNSLAAGYDLAIGSRLIKGARTKRYLKREVLSRGYNLLVKILFWNKFSDGQCGFKAVSREVKEKILPLVKNGNWFFDTELLLLSERAGFRIKDAWVEWVEDLETKVKIFKTIWEDIKGLWRVRFSKVYRQIKNVGI